MNLRELVDSVDVPETRVAEGAWDNARSRLVRRRAWTAGAAGVLVAAILVGVSAIPGGQRAERPAPMDTPTPSPTTAPAELVVTRPEWGALAVNRVPPPTRDAVPLSEDPVDHASLVMADPEDEAGAYVLGDDGEWRLLDVPGLVPVTDGANTSPVVWPTSLNGDGTLLALPQPDALVVVDLTRGDGYYRYNISGYNHYVSWVDDTHVLVSEETSQTGTLVDLETGDLEPSAYGPSTRVLADGSALTWNRGAGAMEWSDGRMIGSPVNNSAGFHPQPPLVRDGLVVGLHFQNPQRAPAPANPPAVLSEANGIVAVDAATGEPLGFLPLGVGHGEASSLLGWAGDLPVLGLVRPEDNAIQTRVVTWDYRSGELHPLAVLPSWWVSWGVGL